jgi:hypothetical protein
LVNGSPDWFEDHYHSEIEPISTSNEKRFICLFSRCKSAFARESDLRRHINAKHNRTTTFFCPAKGCFKKQERRSFSRADKLIAHLRTMHDAHSLGECSHESCRGADPLALIELRVHRLRSLWSELSGYGGFYLLPAWYCPLTACSLRKSQYSLYDHISKHLQNGDSARLEAAADALQKKHLQLAVVGIDSREFDEERQTMQVHVASQVIGVHIICPVCQLHCSDGDEFQDHMVEIHLVEPSQQEHLKAWMAEQRPLFNKPSFWCSTRFEMLPSYPPSANVNCPACGYLEPGSRSSHHRDLFRKELDYLKPYRVDIAELYPEFTTEPCWKPVWDDLEGPLRKTPAGNSGASPN